MDLRTLIAANRVLSTSSLSYNDILVLGYVAEHQHTCVGAISAALGLLPAGISRALNSLEGQGIITRILNIKDRRKICVQTTKMGDVLYQELNRELGEICA